MRTYVLTHVGDDALLRELDLYAAKDCENSADLLARIAEVDARGLYLPRGYASMRAYCVEKLHMSEGVAYKRVHVARTARAFPILFPAIAEGNLHLTAVHMLAAYFTSENTEQLVREATHKRSFEIQELIARRFPAPELLPDIVPAVSPVVETTTEGGPVFQSEQAARPAHTSTAQGEQAARPARARVTPVSGERVRVELYVSRSTYEKMRYAQNLDSHSMSGSELADLFDQALDALIEKRQKRKFAATAKPRTPSPSPGSKRYVPAHVRRAVWKRDGHRCTFVGDDGHRCAESQRVEFDHVEPVARGGRATVDSMRLRCRAHNQYEAERVFGREFMQRKRQRDPDDPLDRDVLAGLRQLKVGAETAKRALEHAKQQGGTTLEERMRAALQYLWPRGVKMGAPPAMARTG